MATTVASSCVVHHFQTNDFSSRFCRFDSTINTHLFNSKPKKSLIRCQSTSTDERKRSRNFLDNASNFLTNLLSGGNLGSMPVAEGAVSVLFGKPLFFPLYD